MQRERRRRKDAEGDGDERSLAGGGSKTREAVFPGARCSHTGGFRDFLAAYM